MQVYKPCNHLMSGNVDESYFFSTRKYILHFPHNMKSLSLIRWLR